MRDKCELDYPRCRICLDNLIDGQTHECSNIVRCAQCDGPHHSLSSDCGKVVEYRSDLKEQVNNAIFTGKLHRIVPQDRAQPMQFQMKQNEFPAIPPLNSRATPWKLASVQPTVTNMNGSEDITKMLLTINQNILDMKENTHRIDEKLDLINDQVNQNALDTGLHHETLENLLPILASLISQFVWPLMSKEQQPPLQKLFDQFKTVSSHLKSDYTARRKRSASPPLRLSPSQPSKTTDNNNTPNNESDQNMSR